MPPPPEIPVVFGRWESFVHWLFLRTADFPRRLRPTLTQRIEALALEVFELLVAARFGQQRPESLRRANLRLDTLRLLLRLARTLGCLGGDQTEHAMREIDTVGRMVGGWLRSQPA